MSLYSCKVLLTVVFYSGPPVSKRSRLELGRDKGSKGGELIDHIYMRN